MNLKYINNEHKESFHFIYYNYLNFTSTRDFNLSSFILAIT